MKKGDAHYDYETTFFRFQGRLDENGRPAGPGALRLVSGEVLEGCFTYGELNGKGVKTWPDGSVYRGGFLDGEMEGYGTHFCASSMQLFEGMFKQGVRSGQGTIHDYASETVYTGSFKNGFPDGEGELKSMDPNSSYCVKGLWKAGRLDGASSAVFDNEDTMEGDCSEGLWNGLCLFRSHRDGVRYNGPFLQGKRIECPDTLTLTSFVLSKTMFALNSLNDFSSYSPALVNGVSPIPPHSTFVLPEGQMAYIELCQAKKDIISSLVAETKGSRKANVCFRQVQKEVVRPMCSESGRPITLSAYNISSYLAEGCLAHDLALCTVQDDTDDPLEIQTPKTNHLKHYPRVDLIVDLIKWFCNDSFEVRNDARRYPRGVSIAKLSTPLERECKTLTETSVDGVAKFAFSFPSIGDYLLEFLVNSKVYLVPGNSSIYENNKFTFYVTCKVVSQKDKLLESKHGIKSK